MINPNDGSWIPIHEAPFALRLCDLPEIDLNTLSGPKRIFGLSFGSVRVAYHNDGVYIECSREERVSTALIASFGDYLGADLRTAEFNDENPLLSMKYVRRALAAVVARAVSDGRIEVAGRWDGTWEVIPPDVWRGFQITNWSRGEAEACDRERATRIRVRPLLAAAAPPAHSPNAPKKRGPKPEKLELVKNLMRKMDRGELESLTEEAMAATFDASRDTCRRARNQVLSEFVGDKTPTIDN